MTTNTIPEDGATFEDIIIPLLAVAEKALVKSEGQPSIWSDYDGYDLDNIELVKPIKERGDTTEDVITVGIQLGICQGKRIAHENGILVYDTQLLQWLGKANGELCLVQGKGKAHTFKDLNEAKDAICIETNPEHIGRYELLSIVVGAHTHQMD
jgi:hypothetical protein